MSRQSRSLYPNGVMPNGLKNGFTLVELLVAIAVLGLLLTTAFGALSVGSRSWERGVARAEATQNLRRSVDFLRRQFAHLTPISEVVGREQVIAFTGSPGGVRFVAPAPESLGDAGMVIVALEIEERNDDVAVWFGVAPLDPGQPTDLDKDGIYRRSLFTELAGASISYFGSQKIDEEPQWHADWQRDADRFPTLVRLVTSEIDGPNSPDLIFRIRSEELL
jgi:general secretion pathway protein J